MTNSYMFLGGQKTSTNTVEGSKKFETHVKGSFILFFEMRNFVLGFFSILGIFGIAFEIYSRKKDTVKKVIRYYPGLVESKEEAEVVSSSEMQGLLDWFKRLRVQSHCKTSLILAGLVMILIEMLEDDPGLASLLALRLRQLKHQRSTLDHPMTEISECSIEMAAIEEIRTIEDWFNSDENQQQYEFYNYGQYRVLLHYQQHFHVLENEVHHQRVFQYGLLELKLDILQRQSNRVCVPDVQQIELYIDRICEIESKRVYLDIHCGSQFLRTSTFKVVSTEKVIPINKTIALISNTLPVTIRIFVPRVYRADSLLATVHFDLTSIGSQNYLFNKTSSLTYRIDRIYAD